MAEGTKVPSNGDRHHSLKNGHCKATENDKVETLRRAIVFCKIALSSGGFYLLDAVLQFPLLTNSVHRVINNLLDLNFEEKKITLE